MPSPGDEVERVTADDQAPEEEDNHCCWTCGGQGWGFVGTDWDSDDPINGPYDGEAETCPNCLGSGLAKDCWYW